MKRELSELIESHRLSDGTLVEVKRFEDSYTFLHTGKELLDPPIVEIGLTLDEALEMLADVLRSDVLELE